MQFARSLSLGLAVLMLAAAASPGGAQFPGKPVTIVVPFAAGGPTDVVMRILAEQLAEKWKQPVVVDNKPGGGTIVGTNAILNSKPDGYTLGVATNAFFINPGVRKSLPYDTLKDFVGVTKVVDQPFVLVAHPSFQANSVKELIELARKAEPPLSYASPGPAGGGHLAGELLAREAGIKLQNVPYKGSAPALTDLLAGRVPFMFDIWHSCKPHVEAGKLKLIATAGPERLKDAPNAPTMAETIPGFNIVAFQALFARAGVPDDILNQLSSDIGEIVKSPKFAEAVAKFSVTPGAMTPKEFDAWARSEIERWKKTAEGAGITIE
jgi:tripartite-type tricarboxylate transporter receptor subunit TctC